MWSHVRQLATDAARLESLEKVVPMIEADDLSGLHGLELPDLDWIQAAKDEFVTDKGQWIGLRLCRSRLSPYPTIDAAAILREHGQTSPTAQTPP